MKEKEKGRKIERGNEKDIYRENEGERWREKTREGRERTRERESERDGAKGVMTFKG